MRLHNNKLHGPMYITYGNVVSVSSVSHITSPYSHTRFPVEFQETKNTPCDQIKTSNVYR